MSDPPKRLAAVLYLPLDAAGRDLLELIAEAGAIEIRSVPDAGGALYCRWAGLNSEARLIRSAFHGILVISFWQSEFLRLVDGDSGETEPDDRPIVEAFRKVCEALNPVFAFIATHLDQATEEWIIGLEWPVLNYEANRLATQGLGLVYFSPEMDNHWTPHPVQEDRDMLSVSCGRLIFAGKGQSRWFG